MLTIFRFTPRLVKNGRFSTQLIQRRYSSHFFTSMNKLLGSGNRATAMDNLLCDELRLRYFLVDYLRINYQSDNYLGNIFIKQLNDYAIYSPNSIKDYFEGHKSLNGLSRDFARFCFSKDLRLDRDRTLASFEHHNALSNKAVKNKLLDLPYQRTIQLFGYGLGDGAYEKELAQFLIKNDKAQEVNLFGYDPCTKNIPEINLLTSKQIRTADYPNFDIIVARWVLHHVELKHRWDDFIQCIKRCSTTGSVFIVEHGFLKNKPQYILDERFFYLIHATLDVVANIGIRPEWFLNTYPNIGDNFFIQYLTPDDFDLLCNKSVERPIRQTIDNCGPAFSNQTLHCLSK